MESKSTKSNPTVGRVFGLDNLCRLPPEQMRQFDPVLQIIFDNYSIEKILVFKGFEALHRLCEKNIKVDYWSVDNAQHDTICFS